jgi:hypothetical protein
MCSSPTVREDPCQEFLIVRDRRELDRLEYKLQFGFRGVLKPETESTLNLAPAWRSQSPGKIAQSRLCTPKGATGERSREEMGSEKRGGRSDAGKGMLFIKYL